jgi:hypothetical protein
VQNGFVRTLRMAGCSVELTHRLGGGFPDLAVGRNGITLLVEVKTPGSLRRLTPDEVEWHECWRGAAMVTDDPMDVLRWFGVVD